MKKTILILTVFTLGVFIGRQSMTINSAENLIENTTSKMKSSNKHTKLNINKSFKSKSSFPPLKISSNKKEQTDSKFVRKRSSVDEKEIDNLFNKFMLARRSGDYEEQNSLFAKMENVQSKHENVFRAKVAIMQDDEDWKGAHEILKECLEVNPNSMFCIKRMSNIRSSTNEDKLKYASLCLENNPADHMCTIDFAIALKFHGELDEALKFFDKALKMSNINNVYPSKFIWLQKAKIHQEMGMDTKADLCYEKACQLGIKSACL